MFSLSTGWGLRRKGGREMLWVQVRGWVYPGSALHCFSSLAGRIVLGIMFTAGIYGVKEQREGGKEGREGREKKERKGRSPWIGSVDHV